MSLSLLFSGVFSNDSQNGSKWPIWLTWKVWNAIGDLFPSLSIFVVLPHIRVSSFSFSYPLLQSFNRQGSKHNNLAKESGPSCNIKHSVLPWILQFSLFSWQPKFFYGNHFTIKGRQMVTFWKTELGAL